MVFAWGTAVPPGALALGFSCAGLGTFGAYEFANRLKGEVTCLVRVAPLVAVSARFIPIAETTWRGGQVSLRNRSLTA